VDGAVTLQLLPHVYVEGRRRGKLAVRVIESRACCTIVAPRCQFANLNLKFLTRFYKPFSRDLLVIYLVANLLY
jgi:hypothetical protein